jgi:hypothetical protein
MEEFSHIDKANIASEDSGIVAIHIQKSPPAQSYPLLHKLQYIEGFLTFFSRGFFCLREFSGLCERTHCYGNFHSKAHLFAPSAFAVLRHGWQ